MHSSQVKQIWIITVTDVGHFEKWLPQPPEAEFEMAQYPNVFII